MRGKFSKDSTFSKTSTKESLVQIVHGHSPSHPKTTNILENPNEECRDEVNENPNDTLAGQLGTSSSKYYIVLEKVHPNTSLLPHKSTWFTNFVEHLWKEHRKRKRNHEE